MKKNKIMKNFDAVLARTLKPGLKVNASDTARLMAAVRERKNPGVGILSPVVWGSAVSFAAAFCLLAIVLQPGSFTLESVKGAVSFSAKNSVITVRAGTRILPGTVVLTSRSGRCWLKFGKNVFFIEPGSSLMVRSVRGGLKGDSAVLELASGKMFGNFSDKASLRSLTIRMDDTTACVRGTVFMTGRLGQGKKVVSVLRGRVKVCSASSAGEADAGETLVVDKDRGAVKSALVRTDSFSPVLDFYMNHTVAASLEAADLQGLKAVEDADFTYFVSEDGRVLCVSRKTFSIVWECRVPRNVTASPAIDAGRLYVNSSDGTLSCVADGKILWQKNCGPAVYSSPVIEAGTVFITTTKGRVCALEVSDGRLIWSTGLREGIFSTPTVRKDAVYVATLNSAVTRLDRETGKIVWTARLEGRILDCPAVCVDGAVFAATSAGYLYKLNDSDGKLVFSRPLKAAVSGPMTIQNDVLYVTTDRLQLFSGDGTVISETAPANANYIITGNDILADNGRVDVYGLNAEPNGFFSKSADFRLFSSGSRLFIYDNKFIKEIN